MRYDENLGRFATKWERSYSTTNNGLEVRVRSQYRHRQSRPSNPPAALSTKRHWSASPCRRESLNLRNVPRASSMDPVHLAASTVSRGVQVPTAHQEVTEQQGSVWLGFIDPDSLRRWRCHPSDPCEYFFEDSAEWKRFQDPESDRFWWWHESTSRVAFEA